MRLDHEKGAGCSASARSSAILAVYAAGCVRLPLPRSPKKTDHGLNTLGNLGNVGLHHDRRPPLLRAGARQLGAAGHGSGGPRFGALAPEVSYPIRGITVI
jgi:hypothetical protein